MGQIKVRWAASLTLGTALSFFPGPRCWAGHTLTPQQEAVLQEWLQAHPGHRKATVDDCSCAADVENTRQSGGGKWRPVPDYHPYVVSGDLNSDGVLDFAVVLIDAPGEWVLLIFNGPSVNGTEPAFVDTGLDFERRGLFYGPPRPEPHRLVIGPFYSHGVVVVPRDGTYEIQREEE